MKILKPRNLQTTERIEKKDKSLPITNQHAALVTTVETACPRKIFQAAPMRLSSWWAPQLSTQMSQAQRNQSKGN